MRFLLIGLMLSISTAAWSGTITVYDNGSPNTNPTSDCTALCPELVSGFGAGAFTLPSSVVISGVQFWTLQAPNSYQGGDLRWQICLDDTCSAGSSLGSGSFMLTQDIQGDVNVAGYSAAEYQNDFAVADLSISPSSPSQNFFLNISDPSGKDNFGIFWATSGANTLAFQLTGTVIDQAVPEPATLVLMAGALAGIFIRRRK